ncbi:MAG: amidohydrolase [Micavibrio aeruginosavorus]|uniref:Amidohydrolase n=1 Tax=Micavibrio aeruginosavorus TaxID=349221 RepID=A0A2W5FN83_9BACT|nr:MAG: amidohydrolase [Micavibrio aeruginosavorus]
MTLSNRIPEIAEDMKVVRRELHQNPGTAYEEFFASDMVAAKLTEWGIPFERGWAGTGIVATIEGKNKGTKSIGLRADMDSLDIVEESGQAWTSKIPGKMHACGHDGHTSTLLGAAQYLSETRNFSGKVYLIFQPAEEGAAGASTMIKDGLFDKYPADQIFALHNWPWLQRGKFATRVGPILGAVDRVRITIIGSGGHAANPESTIDPVPAAAEIVLSLQTIVSRNVGPLDNAVVSVTNLNAGTGAENIIPSTASLVISVRSFKTEIRQLLKKRIHEISEGIAKLHNLSCEIDYEHGPDPTTNTKEETDLSVRVANEIFGSDNVEPDVAPWMGAEDFGDMLKVKPGCYILLGQGEADKNSPHNYGLHSNKYDFNDEILPLGIEYFVRLTETALK